MLKWQWFAVKSVHCELQWFTVSSIGSNLLESQQFSGFFFSWQRFSWLQVVQFISWFSEGPAAGLCVTFGFCCLSFWPSAHFASVWWLLKNGIKVYSSNGLVGHEFHETCHSVTSYFMKKDSKRYCDTTTPESIHTKDESKRDSAFAFIFGVNWPVQWK